MSCDTCGLDDPECQCYVYELEKRIAALEEAIDNLTYVVNAISTYLKENHED